MKHKKNNSAPSLIVKNLRGISRALLDGEKRPAFLEFIKGTKGTDDRRGIYALYDKHGRLYYVGKASDLSKRLNDHLKDKHADSWEQMTLFFVTQTANVPELEGLLVATAKPPGNKQKPKTGKDIRKVLESFLKKDAALQINQVVYPDRKHVSDKLSGRITRKKLKSVSQAKLASVLNITQGRVSQLLRDDEKHPGAMRRYIRETGRRDGVLLLLQKANGKS